jgi:hypothetical protein
VFLNDSVSHRDSFAKNAAARFKKSRSCFKILFSRRSQTRSACSAHTELACLALPLRVLLLGSPAVEQVIGNPQIPRHVGHRLS